MIDAHGLEQGPETVTDVQGQNCHACCVEQGIKGAGQYSADSIGNRYALVGKTDIKEMQQNKGKNKCPGVRHGTGSPGSTTRLFADLVAVGTGQQILQEQADTRNNVEEKNGEQDDFGNRYQRSQGVKMFSVGEKCTSTPEN